MTALATVTLRNDMLWKHGKPVVPGYFTSWGTFTSKLPTSSWGIPALAAAGIHTCPSATFTERQLNSTLKKPSDKGTMFICTWCYPRAKTSRYRMPNAKQAGINRLLYTQECIENGNEWDWIDYQVGYVRWATRNDSHFRIHDQGDFYRTEYVRMWIEVAKALPEVDFWASTRAWHLREDGDPVAHEAILSLLRDFHALRNVQVKPSALAFITGEEAELIPGVHLPPVVPGLGGGTGAHLKGAVVPKGIYKCPSHSQKGQCLGKQHGGVDCTACWGNARVAYESTGQLLGRRTRRAAAS